MSADRTKAPGEFVKVDGLNVHLMRSGSGSPTVVIATGSRSPGLRWASLVRRIGEFTSVMVYDRPGLGWSDSTSRPRTLDNVAIELWWRHP